MTGAKTFETRHPGRSRAEQMLSPIIRSHVMKTNKRSRVIFSLITIIAAEFFGCNLVTNSNEEPPFSLSGYSLFPFQNINNWWKYTESGGNTLTISVLDTISDNKILYFKVSFAEKNKDTTDDWFKKTSSGILYSPALTGQFELFLPSQFTEKTGTFKSSNSSIQFTYEDSMLVKGNYIKRVMKFHYPNRTLHGFDDLYFAESMGVISLVDLSGRFPVRYMLDSAFIDGEMHR
jgi:hypothetical protein